MKKLFAKNVRLLRNLREWNQLKMASKIGISVPAYSKIELGITDVNLTRLEQIAKIFNVRPETLILPISDLNKTS